MENPLSRTRSASRIAQQKWDAAFSRSMKESGYGRYGTTGERVRAYRSGELPLLGPSIPASPSRREMCRSGELPPQNPVSRVSPSRRSTDHPPHSISVHTSPARREALRGEYSLHGPAPASFVRKEAFRSGELLLHNSATRISPARREPFRSGEFPLHSASTSISPSTGETCRSAEFPLHNPYSRTSPLRRDTLRSLEFPPTHTYSLHTSPAKRDTYRSGELLLHLTSSNSVVKRDSARSGEIPFVTRDTLGSRECPGDSACISAPPSSTLISGTDSSIITDSEIGFVFDTTADENMHSTGLRNVQSKAVLDNEEIEEKIVRMDPDSVKEVSEPVLRKCCSMGASPPDIESRHARLISRGGSSSFRSKHSYCTEAAANNSRRKASQSFRDGELTSASDSGRRSPCSIHYNQTFFSAKQSPLPDNVACESFRNPDTCFETSASIPFQWEEAPGRPKLLSSEAEEHSLTRKLTREDSGGKEEDGFSVENEQSVMRLPPTSTVAEHQSVPTIPLPPAKREVSKELPRESISREFTKKEVSMEFQRLQTSRELPRKDSSRDLLNNDDRDEDIWHSNVEPVSQTQRLVEVVMLDKDDDTRSVMSECGKMEEVHIDLIAPSAAKFLTHEDVIISTPLKNVVAVPFKWEEIPGRPKAATAPSAVTECILQLPPRLLGARAHGRDAQSKIHVSYSCNLGDLQGTASNAPSPTSRSRTATPTRVPAERYVPRSGPITFPSSSGNNTRNFYSGPLRGPHHPNCIVVDKDVSQDGEAGAKPTSGAVDPWSPTSILCGPDDSSHRSASNLSTANSESSTSAVQLGSAAGSVSGHSKSDSCISADSGSAESVYDLPPPWSESAKGSPMFSPFQDLGPTEEIIEMSQGNGALEEGMKAIANLCRKAKSWTHIHSLRKKISPPEPDMWAPTLTSYFQRLEIGGAFHSKIGVQVIPEVKELNIQQAAPIPHSPVMFASPDLGSWDHASPNHRLSKPFSSRSIRPVGLAASPLRSPSYRLMASDDCFSGFSIGRIWSTTKHGRWTQKMKRSSKYMGMMYGAVKRSVLRYGRKSRHQKQLPSESTLLELEYAEHFLSSKFQLNKPL